MIICILIALIWYIQVYLKSVLTLASKLQMFVFNMRMYKLQRSFAFCYMDVIPWFPACTCMRRCSHPPNQTRCQTFINDKEASLQVSANSIVPSVNSNKQALPLSAAIGMFVVWIIHVSIEQCICRTVFCQKRVHY